MTAKEYLSRYTQCEIRIKAKNEKIQELKAMATSISITFGEKVQSSKNIDKKAKIMDYYMDLENSLLLEIKELKLILKEIEDKINQLDDLMQKNILEQKYINNYSFAKIAANCGYSERQIFRAHGKALEQLNLL